MLLFLLACTPEPTSDPIQAEPGVETQDNLGGNEAVRVTSPANGETVASTFTLAYRAGAALTGIELLAAGTPVVALTEIDPGDGELVVTLPEGKYDLELVGYSDDNVVSSDFLTIRVSDGGPWVTITSPSDGAEVANPVTFTFTASEGIESIDLVADGWSIGSVGLSAAGDGQFTYTFSGTGYDRELIAQAGEASDTLSFTVTPEENPAESNFNDIVWNYLESYPTDGTHGFYWPTDTDWNGTTRDIWYLDTLVAEGDEQGRCFCVGLTWEVYMRAWEEVDRTTGGDGTINGMSVSDLYTFRVDWFVREVDGPGPSIAMENYGVGEEITDFSKLQPGDFVQFWRHSGSGHNVIFVDWLIEGDEIVGLEYWSTQSTTDGIGYNSERFGSSGSYIDPNLLFAARGWMPENWMGWK